MQRHAPWLYAFWKFSRPHTIIGTSLSVLGLYAIALSQRELGLEDITASLPTIIGTLLACLCGNVYIVGLNQLEDVSIDRINKPHLPLASGEFSRREAIGIVMILGVAALLLSLWQGSFLFGMVSLSLLIGTAYSLPPIRLKRFPLLASLCIFTVRGVVVNLGLFLHFNQRLLPDQPDRWLQIPASVWALTLFVLVFTFAIAIFKDIPDLEGDRRYNINTFTLQLGAPAVFNLARWVLTVCYVGIMVAGFFLASVQWGVLILTHAVALVALWIRSRQVNLQEKRSIARYYQFIWKLFFLEYIMFPIACLLA
jgi:homogentisate phytyltransferase/homogentisate geranylgeranyltransferase